MRFWQLGSTMPIENLRPLMLACGALFVFGWVGLRVSRVFEGSCARPVLFTFCMMSVGLLSWGALALLWLKLLSLFTLG